MAMKRHKHHINTRYIEVYKANGEDFINVAGGNSSEAQAFLTKGAQVIVRMRGLPYDCTAKDVITFFENGDQTCSVMDGEDGVLFVKKPDGRATGDAFVLFADEDDAPKALSKHRDLIGTRYIELFRSTTAEVQQVLNRAMDPTVRSTASDSNGNITTPVTTTANVNNSPTALMGHVPLLPLPQHVITSGTRKDCIRLRGLPYEANVEHILEFLGEHSKNIVFQGVHMVYNSVGHASGEAFIQMNNEGSAAQAAMAKHHNYMSFGKKQRYIEVFQCSGEDMHLVLTGGGAAAGALSPVTAKLLSPPGGPLMTSPPFPPPAASYSPFAGPPPPPPPPPLMGHHHHHHHHQQQQQQQQPPPPPSLGAPYPPPILYWPYPSPPISPPHQPPALLIMQGTPPPMAPPQPPVDVCNLIHSVSEWNIDYVQQNPQFCTMNVGPMGMHSAAA